MWNSAATGHEGVLPGIATAKTLERCGRPALTGTSSVENLPFSVHFEAETPGGTHVINLYLCYLNDYMDCAHNAYEV
jgi:hypothetical protein